MPNANMYKWDGTNFVPYDGSVSVSASVSGTLPVTGTVGVSGTVPVSGTVGVSGTVPVSIPGTPTFTVSGTSPISGTVGVSGTVPVSIPGTPTFTVSGTAPVSIPGTPTVNVNTVTMVQAGTVETTPYTTVKSGELAIGTAAGGTTTASIACKLVRFKARSSNAGTVYIGGGTTITTPDGTTDTTTGMGMVASDDTGWIPASNVNQFFFISSGTANAVTYLAVV